MRNTVYMLYSGIFKRNMGHVQRMITEGHTTIMAEFLFKEWKKITTNE